MINYQLQKIESNTKNNRKVLIIYTGGTLGMVYDNKLDSLVPFKFDRILDDLPELKRLGLDLYFLSFNNIFDSSNVSPINWIELAEIIKEYYEQFDGFVILHGTDTMAYTASALSFMIQKLSKTIVLTGAQLPIGLPRTDARENLITSIEIAGASINGNAIVPEVCIYFNGRLLRGNRSKKQESSQFDAFESENLPYLAEIGVVIDYNYSIIKIATKDSLMVFTELEQNVGLLKMFPGISKVAIHHFFSQTNLKGVVLETYGAGNAPSEDWFLEELDLATKKGIVIFNVSQCTGGKVMMGKYETSKRMIEMGIISGSDITSEAAITKMMYVLAVSNNLEEQKSILATNLCGEMS